MPWAIFQDKPDTKAIIELISSNSPRVAAVVGGALLDEHVRETLLERLRESGVAEGLLRIEGPLGNLGPKIDLLYLLHAFEKRTYKALKGISEIRNFFAHHLDTSRPALLRDFQRQNILANFYQASIYAWNAFREDRTITSVKYDTKKGLYTITA